MEPERQPAARVPHSPAVRVAETIAKTEVRPDGVAVITIDDPAEAHNTITPAMAGELTTALDHVAADARVRAIVVRSGKRDSFLAGANIDFVRRIRFAADAEEASREVARRFARFGTAAKPVVAWVHGPALGGGFELALACRAAVVSDDPKTVLGLPEVKLGLVPAANGLLRVAERAGLRAALDLGLSGRALRPDEALRLGLVDAVASPSSGLDVAAARALELARSKAPRSKGPLLARLKSALVEGQPLGRLLILRRARAHVLAETRGHYPAPERILELLERWSIRGFESAARREPVIFGDLVVTETAHRLIELFFVGNAAKKDRGLDPGESAVAAPVVRVGIIGAGPRGAALAATAIRAGLAVSSKEVDEIAMWRGLKRVREHGQYGRVDGATRAVGLAKCDVVIEAVPEERDRKRAALREVESHVGPSTVLASTARSISISSIAQGLVHPERMLGWHDAGALLEIVRTEGTDPRAVATAVMLGKRQGKTVIVVRDGVGSYTPRILVRFVNEALHLLAEGAAVDRIDVALVDWGFSLGPLRLLDEHGIDLTEKVARACAAAHGERHRPPVLLEALRADDRRGRNRRGIYRYAGPRPVVDPTVYDVVGRLPRPASADEIALRCSLALINEALRCLEEGVLRRATDGDLGGVFGVGFPAFRGGPFRYVDVVGPPEILRRTRSLEQRFGERFEPAPLLVEMARTGRRFYT